MVLLLFFCSGATALVYEVLWSKYLSLMFGSTVHAQTVVLSVFMGGLALGNWIFGRRSRVLQRPLLAYGYVELCIAVYAFFFDAIYRGADAIFGAVGPALLNYTWLLLGVKGLLSISLLLIPTVLMGGTLPMLAAWLQQNREESERLSARFYSINSFGAVCGSALAGFYLIKTVGLAPTAQIAALINALVGACAVGLGRRQQPAALASNPPVPEAAPLDSQPLVRWTSLLVALTGAIAMGLEILASRALSLIFGSSLQAFALVLIAFILGIGVGSAIVSASWWQRRARSVTAPLLLSIAAAWILILIFKIESWVEFYRWAKTGLAASEAGYIYHQWFIVLGGLIVLGLPAALIGAVLPLTIQRACGQGALGAQVGRLLTWNTIGAVVGVLLTGFVLMPQLGLRNAFAFMALALGITALGFALARRERFAGLTSGAAVLAALLVFAIGNDRWQLVLSAGAFRSRDTAYDPTVMQQRRAAMQLIYYKDGPDATVSVERSTRSGHFFMRVNGKTDASSRGDFSTQVLCAHVPMMARPDAQDVFVLGLGSGITSGAVLAHPIKRLIVAENCRPVIEAARIFSPFNNGVLQDPRARIVAEDGRTVLKLSPQEYDVIISQPSNPWTAGNGNVFSREYYQLAASRLKAGGLMVQWFHVYEIHDGIVALVVRTFGEVFPHFEVWDSGSGDVLLVGSKTPWATDWQACARVYQRPVVREQLESIGLGAPERLLARQLASQRTAFAIAGAGPVQSDYFPMLEYEAPKAFFIGKHATLFRDYDERTLQSPLLPDYKRQALSKLDDTALRAVFGEFASVNDELMRVLVARLNTPTAVPAPLGSIFHLDPHIATNDSEIELTMRQLEETGTRNAALQRLRGWLNDSSTNGLPTAVLATRAARRTLAAGDYRATRTLLEIGLAAEPAEAQLNFISRLLEREAAQALASAKK